MKVRPLPPQRMSWPRVRTEQEAGEEEVAAGKLLGAETSGARTRLRRRARQSASPRALQPQTRTTTKKKMMTTKRTTLEQTHPSLVPSQPALAQAARPRHAGHPPCSARRHESPPGRPLARGCCAIRCDRRGAADCGQAEPCGTQQRRPRRRPRPPQRRGALPRRLPRVALPPPRGAGPVRRARARPRRPPCAPRACDPVHRASGPRSAPTTWRRRRPAARPWTTGAEGERTCALEALAATTPDSGSLHPPCARRGETPPE